VDWIVSNGVYYGISSTEPSGSLNRGFVCKMMMMMMHLLKCLTIAKKSKLCARTKKGKTI
jgi:hypothetical protein